MAMERDFVWGDRCTMQCADDVLLSFIPETCMVLQTSLTPINLINNHKQLLKQWQHQNSQGGKKTTICLCACSHGVNPTTMNDFML